jgi:pyruvate dehydrogenase E1 component alpha subunit
MYDPDRYRDKAEIASWRERDPIELLAARMSQDGELDEDTRQAMTAEVRAEIDRAVQAAEDAAFEPVDDLARFLYTEPEP